MAAQAHRGLCATAQTHAHKLLTMRVQMPQATGRAAMQLSQETCMTLTEIASAARDMNIARQKQHRTALEQHEQAIEHNRETFSLHSTGNQRQAALATDLQSIPKDPW